MIASTIKKLGTFSLVSCRRIEASSEAATAAVCVAQPSPVTNSSGVPSSSLYLSEDRSHVRSIASSPAYAGFPRNDSSPFPTVKRWFGSRNSPELAAGQLFDGMPHRAPNSRGAHFDRLLGLLRVSSAGQGDPSLPSTAHCLALKIGALSHLPVLTSLIMAYSRAGELSCCRDMFNEITGRDVIIYNVMITSLVNHGYFEDAVGLFSKMLSRQIGFSSITLLLIVSALTCSGGLLHGRVLHGLALKSGGVSDSSLCNALIDMYAKFGDLRSSEIVFHEMGSRRDTISWNSMVSGFLHGNDPERCLLYFLGSSHDGGKVDCIGLSCAISAAGSLRELRWGRILHALSIKVGLENNPNNNSVANSLVSFYSAYGQIEAAEMIFLEMVGKDTVSWNRMIEGLRLNGEIGEAIFLLHEMQFTAQNRPDKVTLLSICSICADDLLLDEGKAVHGFILRGGMESDSSLINSLIYMYGKCGKIENAHILFECMIPRRDLVSWNTMISGYTQSGLNKAAQTLFREMLKGSVECSAATLLAVLPSCDSPEFLVLGKLIHSWTLKLGFSTNNLVLNSIIYMYVNCGGLETAFSLFWRDSDKEDATSWNTIIGGCVQKEYFREALATFHSMMKAGNVAFDFITLVSVLSACGNLELLFGGSLIHGLAVKALLGSETRVQNALITMYGRCREIESARSVFITGHNLNLCSWNCLISAFCQNKNPIEALDLFCHLDLDPDEFTITGVITACTQLGFITHGKQIHAHVLRCKLHNNPVICSALLDMYSNCGRLDLASRVFRELPNKSVVAWNSIISAYGCHGEGKKALEIFKDMCRHGTQPNNGTFTSLLSACSHSGLVKEGLHYYDQMLKEFGVEPSAEHRVCTVDMLGRSGELDEAYSFIMQKGSRLESGPLGALLSWSKFYGNIELAREAAKALFELDPDNTGYYISLSNMYVAAGGWKEAVELREIVEMKRLRKPPGYSLMDVGSV